jgi:acetyl esterase
MTENATDDVRTNSEARVMEEPNTPFRELDPLAVGLAANLARTLGLRFPDPSAECLQIPRSVWDVGSVADFTVACAEWAVPIRVYRPLAMQIAPVLVYIHGGGWFSGNLDAVDADCREICARAACVVVSVDYSLSKVHKFPRALHEVDAVCRWISERAASIGGDPARLAIGGDSAGGNLAAAECLLARERGGRSFRLQLLIYPMLDPNLARSEIVGSQDPIMSPGLLRIMWERYVASQADLRDPLAAPLRAESFAGLPTAMIVTAGTDPLRAEGRRFGAALEADGVAVTYHDCEGLFHGFFGMPHPQAQAAMLAVIGSLNEAFSD